MSSIEESIQATLGKLKQIDEKNKTTESLIKSEARNTLLVLVGIIAVIMILVGSYLFSETSISLKKEIVPPISSSINQTTENYFKKIEKISKTINETKSNIALIKGEMDVLKLTADKISDALSKESLKIQSPKLTLLSSEIKILKQSIVTLKDNFNKAQIDHMEEQINKLYVAIELKPEEAISLPLIRSTLKRVEINFSDKYMELHSQATKINEKVDYFISVWFIVVVGFLGAVIGPMIAARKKSIVNDGKLPITELIELMEELKKREKNNQNILSHLTL